ncbi:MAG: hypothetical protein FJX45_17635 [Alphaproteobacteria bacterium]|nr:hypothetical protein [Alphaproteobacteria bacterium]MBM3654064.1 hypothetical protein [Alphaproteobacteria bacterium]
MKPYPVSLSPHHEAIKDLEDAARKLRERFRSSVNEALPEFARQLFERQWQESCDLTSIEEIQPLALVYLISCERCVHDLITKNYDGVANSHFEKCVSEASNDIRAQVIGLWSFEGSAIRILRERTA